MSSSSSAPAAVAKICFNSHCKEALLDPPPTRKKGWRLRSGDIAELCDRCSSTFEQGNFCETYHSGDGGWRNCETCGKRVHCGCIVSVSTYVFLDAGGVDCVACARKSVMAPNPMLSSPMHVSQQVSDRREFSSKSWKTMSGPFFGQWRQAPHMWNITSAQSDLQQRLSYEFDRPNCIEKPSPGGRYSILAHEKNLSDRPASSSLNNVVRERYANGKVSVDATSAFGTFREGNTDGARDSSHLIGENDSISTRKTGNTDPCSTSSSGANLEAHPSSCINPLSSSAIKDESSPLGLAAASFQSANGSNELSRFSANQSQCQAGPMSKQFYPQSLMDADLQAQMRNGKPRVDNRARSQSTLLPRYWPRITDQELQQISGDSNSVITPLFEKMLSASDAGRIGRLVLPKKCAEAYFPTISQPEGLPLKVQDASGKDWVFQFRFWPNNNSRMYVLEGVTPCIQAMQLQAGDTVTFSRIDPEGKLIMGFRKASGASTEQDSQTLKSGNGFSTLPDGESKGTAKDFKGEPRNLISSTEHRNCSKFPNEGVLLKDGFGTRLPQGTNRRKGSNLGSKSKRLRIENEDSMELKLTWEEAQQLLRPPPNCVPSVVLVEGHEFEEYEEAPILGKRTYFTTNQSGEHCQWAQCEDCLKWRRLPADALLPSRWTCLSNTWDPERSMCSAAQELSSEQLTELIPCKAGTSKRSKVKVETDNIEVSDGLDTLANLAILGEGENLPPPSQPTTKHPRHRPGCTCIVCIQPPSGKGPKHKQTCTCNVCLTVKRRFRTLMLRREKRQSEKEAETSKKQLKQQPNPSPEKAQPGTEPSNGPSMNNSPQKTLLNDEGTSDELERKRVSPSPIKAPQIDLNIQPEREEEPSPKSDTGNMMRLLQDAAT